MLQGVFLNEQKGLPWVFSLCFKQERALSKNSCIQPNEKVLCECISHHPRGAGGEGKCDSFPCSIKTSGAGGTGSAAVSHVERHQESPI